LLEFSSRGHLPSTTNAIRAVEVECFQQVNLAVAQPKLISLPLREVVWVIVGHFRKAVFSCCCRCGHVGNALALAIMSTAMSAAPPARSAEWRPRIVRRGCAGEDARYRSERCAVRYRLDS